MMANDLPVFWQVLLEKWKLLQEVWCLEVNHITLRRAAAKPVRIAESLLLISDTVTPVAPGAQEASDIWGPNTLASTGPDPVIASYNLVVVLMFNASDV